MDTLTHLGLYFSVGTPREAAQVGFEAWLGRIKGEKKTSQTHKCL